MALVDRRPVKVFSGKAIVPQLKEYEIRKPESVQENIVKTHNGATRDLQTAFSMLDKNCDGLVCVDDIYEMMNALGFLISKEHVTDFITCAGKDESVTEHEFIAWMETLDHNRQQDADEYILRGAFDTFDKDKDGYISREELKHGLLLIGESLSDDVIDLMMTEADKDRDGLISYQEFADIMR